MVVTHDGRRHQRFEVGTLTALSRGDAGGHGAQRRRTTCSGDRAAASGSRAGRGPAYAVLDEDGLLRGVEIGSGDGCRRSADGLAGRDPAGLARRRSCSSWRAGSARTVSIPQLPRCGAGLRRSAADQHPGPVHRDLGHQRRLGRLVSPAASTADPSWSARREPWAGASRAAGCDQPDRAGRVAPGRARPGRSPTRAARRGRNPVSGPPRATDGCTRTFRATPSRPLATTTTPPPSGSSSTTSSGTCFT